MAYEVWGYFHILVLTFWLGADMGVMLTVKKSADTSLSPETRFKMLEMGLMIELLPRVMWTLAFVIGLHLAQTMGLVAFGTMTFVIVWVLTGAFFVTNVGSAILVGKPLGETLTRINNVVVPGLGVLFVGIGLWSYFGNGPFEDSWLAAKITLFGVVNLTTYGILWAFDPAVPAFLKLLSDGSSPETEEVISASVGKTMMFVYTTYILIAFVAFIGVFKVF